MIIKCEAGEFEITQEMKPIIEKLGTPYAAGIFKKKEHASLQEIMLKKIDMPKVIVNKKAEQLFLYGRDVLEKSIISKQADSGIVVVCNENNDKLGIGEIRNNMVHNIADIGMYLRKE